jgi:hypothetical protein
VNCKHSHSGLLFAVEPGRAHLVARDGRHRRRGRAAGVVHCARKGYAAVHMEVADVAAAAHAGSAGENRSRGELMVGLTCAALVNLGGASA